MQRNASGGGGGGGGRSEGRGGRAASLRGRILVVASLPPPLPTSSLGDHCCCSHHQCYSFSTSVAVWPKAREERGGGDFSASNSGERGFGQKILSKRFNHQSLPYVAQKLVFLFMTGLPIAPLF